MFHPVQYTTHFVEYNVNYCSRIFILFSQALIFNLEVEKKLNGCFQIGEHTGLVSIFKIWVLPVTKRFDESIRIKYDQMVNNH